MNKKAAAMGVLVIIILGSIAIVISTVFVIQLQAALDEEFTQQECRASLLLTKQIKQVQQAAQDATFVPLCVVPAKSVPLRCTRNFLYVDGEEVRKESPDGEEVTRLYDATCPAPKEDFGGEFSSIPDGEACLVNNVIAEEMRKCWQLFFEGRDAVFQQVEEAEWKFWLEKDRLRTCFVCAEITTALPVEGYYPYLQSKYIDERDVAEEDPITYYEYLAEDPNARCDPRLVDPEANPPYDTCWGAVAIGAEDLRGGTHKPRIPLDGISGETNIRTTSDAGIADTSEKTYAVTFIRRGMGSCERVKADDAQGYLTNTVHLLPADRISSYCDTVMI